MILGAFAVAFPLAQAQAQPLLELSVGVVPQQSASDLAKSWGPLIQYLGQRCQLNLHFDTAPDIPTFESRLADGLYDLAYMNPLHYVHFHVSPGYLPLTREKNRPLSGLILVRNDSPIHAISDLQGKTLALPAPESFAASVLPLAELTARGIRVTPRYVGSHDSVYLGVSKGFFAAGGGINRTWLQQTPAIRSQLRILWQTPPHTPHAFATHPRLAPETRSCLRQALVGLADGPEGRGLLKTLQLTPQTAAQDSDWDDIRRLRIPYTPPTER
ncbi:phosphate/phosphite/phosphonate ABC transporter substrate-binding protein [Chromobacterium sp. IIBBL 290-4]|uniref:phosphate/phosphite/phosphonate ABC transporter substrate-binding protein n=1 Tax=Chromobacterium sp. IIBBL 290-4 TaxID=2953890 RepID=UPI0020B854A1|nr:phosphate/phosphite/phosphonate ABC transporter substrate-binding protein [Chromobacterium sp. IIBBL 290-4]UTH74831.1 phosphate/phosphite/phosphonate ABC transporter substrate-binding protein [Chromobacterium sp. IIBBL 290-4]